MPKNEMTEPGPLIRPYQQRYALIAQALGRFYNVMEAMPTDMVVKATLHSASAAGVLFDELQNIYKSDPECLAVGLDKLMQVDLLDFEGMRVTRQHSHHVAVKRRLNTDYAPVEEERKTVG